MATVTNTVSIYIRGGIDAVTEFKRSINSDNARRKVDGRTETRLIELACGPVPEEHSWWTIRLVEKESKVILDTLVGREAICNALKNKLRPHKNDYWCIPAKEDLEFIACKEDIFDVYELPYDEKRTVVCMDEKPY